MNKTITVYTFLLVLVLTSCGKNGSKNEISGTAVITDNRNSTETPFDCRGIRLETEMGTFLINDYPKATSKSTKESIQLQSGDRIEYQAIITEDIPANSADVCGKMQVSVAKYLGSIRLH